MSIDIDIDEITEVFIEESLEGLDIMEHGLLNLDIGAADPETMNAIFRAAHSIKGGGATFGFTEISEFAHDLETLLDEMRQGERAVTREGVDLTLQSVDCLRDMIRALATEEDFSEQAADLRKALAAMMADGTSAPEAAPATTATQVEAEIEPAERPIIGWHISFTPKAELFIHGNDPSAIFAELERLCEGEVICTPDAALDFESMDPTRCAMRWEVTLHDGVERDAIEEVFSWASDDCELTIDPILGQPVVLEPVVSDSKPDEAAAAAPAAAPAAAAQAEAKPKPEAKKSASKGKGSGGSESSSIRVNIDKIDNLINLVGELVITQSMLSRFNGDFDFTQLPALREGLAQLSRNTRELQDSVMAIRMLPISFAFARFPRLVRDTGNALGKTVDLQVVGEGTELDKTVLEKIGDPLVHLVRNSLDHGLETPEQRVAAGKPETGVLELRAYHEGGNIVIEVSDDGAGINSEKVLEKAIERGLVSADEVLSEERIVNLIFMPGFSTADAVSDLSGRGVGMDVVRRNIADLGGHVSVKSERGVGSTFTIRLPLTLAILDGQLVRVGQESYIVPLVSIVETIQSGNEHTSQVAGESELFRLRDEYLPVLRLHELFGIQGDATEIDDGLLVVAEANGQRVGIFVDDLQEQQQVVIKSLESNFRQTAGISGATILGDGTVALIIDVPGLIQLFFDRIAEQRKQDAVA
ncbi:MAG: chemotaxis protein CheA [Pseudomonadota bacterium]